MAKRPSRRKSDNPQNACDLVTEGQDSRIRAFFSLVERAANIGYWRYDLSDQSHYWSPRMYDLMGVDPDSQAPDNNWLRHQLPESEQAKILAVLGNAVRARVPFRYRVRGVTLGPLLPDAKNQVIDTQGEVELDADGQVTALIGVCQNVTQKVRDEEERERAQEQYRVMMREASDIIVFYTADGEVLFASDALERVLGRTATEIERGGFLKLIHPNDIAQGKKISVVPLPGETITATYRARHRDGQYLWLEVVARAIYDEAGKVKNIVSVSRDITARKAQEIEMVQAQARAEAANKAKSRFLANMSHELRTPLNAIIGFTELMRKKMFGPLGSERYDEYATIIYDSGQHLLDLITDLLDMAKIEAGKLELNFERVDLCGTIEDGIRLLKDRADAGGVELSARPMDPIFLIADKRAVKQVLINLLSNAVKFTPAGGFVTVWAEQSEGRARLFVRDTGIGISKEDLKRLGNPFEQAHTDAFVTQGGTGLGLALVKSLAESHGGSFAIESTEGKGTTVSVDFPLTQKARAAA